MTGIPTWHERAMRHPDHQSGMISEEMLRARMAEEIGALRAEVERLREALKAQPVAWRHKDAGLLSVSPLASSNLTEWEPLYAATQLRKALEGKP